MRAMRTGLVLCLILAAVGAAGAAPPDLAEGRYPYLAPDPGATPLVARWSGLARAMPDWKHKAKAAHYRFPADKPGRRCDQAECHPGFRDAYVQGILALPEGPSRQNARQDRLGLARCGDCHTWDRIRARTAACRLHFDQPDRVECTACHLEGPKVLEPRGDKKTVSVRAADPLASWPTHRLTRDEKAIPCDQSCHVPQNPFRVEQVCNDCHGEGKLRVARLAAPGVLVHATDPESLWPRLTHRFFLWLTTGVSGALLAYILLDVVRSRKHRQAPAGPGNEER